MNKVLITGGAGFIGSHLVEAYLEAGFEVAVVDLNVPGKLRSKKVKQYRLDVSSPELEVAFADFRPQIVSHHAALIHVPQSLKIPTKYASNNVLGTLNTLELCKKFKVEQFIFASTVAVYGDPKNFPIKEKTICQPLSFYGLDKYSAEAYIKLYQCNFATTVFRYANVYGPAQDSSGEGGVVAIFAQNIAGRRPVTIYGNGKQSRDFVYVKDVARANVLAAQKQVSETMHISTCKETTIAALAELMQKEAKVEIAITKAPRKEGDINRSVLANKKAKKLLGWQPNYNLKTGLQETIAFFSNA
ncbi:NAD-dependent epimerase/dehydratase family protein [Candidatus Beckwithbacteria bacterium]|nr:NAD-dependent epimerase/dehydratase family protein [Candidatus Beckwithbacteria bacterium]